MESFIKRMIKIEDNDVDYRNNPKWQKLNQQYQDYLLAKAKKDIEMFKNKKTLTNWQQNRLSELEKYVEKRSGQWENT